MLIFCQSAVVSAQTARTSTVAGIDAYSESFFSDNSGYLKDKDYYMSTRKLPFAKLLDKK